MVAVLSAHIAFSSFFTAIAGFFSHASAAPAIQSVILAVESGLGGASSSG